MNTIITPLSKKVGVLVKHGKTTIAIDPPHTNHQSTITLITHPHKDHIPPKTLTQTYTNPSSIPILSKMNINSKPITKEIEIGEITIQPIPITHTTFAYSYLIETPSLRLLIAYDWENHYEISKLDPDVIITDCMYANLKNTMKIQLLPIFIKRLTSNKDKVTLSLKSPIDITIIKELSNFNIKIPRHDPILEYLKHYPKLMRNINKTSTKTINLVVKSITTPTETSIKVSSLKLGHPSINDIINLIEESKPKVIALHHANPIAAKTAEKKIINHFPSLRVVDWISQPIPIKN